MKSILIAHRDVHFAEQLATRLRSGGYITIITCPGPWPPQRCVRCDKGYCPLTEGADLMIYDPRLTSVDEHGSAHSLAAESALAHPEVPMLLAWPLDSAPEDQLLRQISGQAPHVRLAPHDPTLFLRQVNAMLRTGSNTVEGTAMKILVVDDDPRLCDALQIGLQLQWEDAHVLRAADGESGLDAFFREEPDLVLLDVTMPRMDGFEVVKEIRRVSDVPIIMLSARGEDVDQARGLELGADDYVAKPFSHLALVARIKAVLRRAEMPQPVDSAPDFVAGELAIHFQNQEVTLAGKPVKLTPVEYRLLYQLVRNAGHLMPHQALLDRVWGSDYEAGPEYLKVFICRLRAKLRTPDGPGYIETERGRGYRFVRPRPTALAG